jgi:hypothetical protein
MDQVRLLTSEDEIAQRTTADDLANFCKNFQKIADAALSKCQTPCKVLVQFTCDPSGHTAQIMHQPKEVDEKLLQEMYEAIDKMEKLLVKAKTVAFQIQLTVTPKNEPIEQQK